MKLRLGDLQWKTSLYCVNIDGTKPLTIRANVDQDLCPEASLGHKEQISVFT